MALVSVGSLLVFFTTSFLAEILDLQIKIYRRPFVVPDKVSWFKMAEALNMKWTSACASNRGLTEENFYFLATNAFR